MNVVKGRFFYTFISLIAIILIVFAFIVMQLFPIYGDDYVALHQKQVEEELNKAIEEGSIKLSSEQSEEFTKIYEQVSSESIKKQLEYRLLLIIMIFTILAFCFIYLVAYRVIRGFIQPINNITQTAQQLSDGNYRARAFASGSTTIIELRNAVNQLASNLQDLTKTRQIEEERLRTLIENMGSSLMMLNREGYISIVNKQFLNNFNLTYHDVYNQNFTMIRLSEELEEFIEHVFLTELPYRKQISIPLNDQTIHKLVYGAPVIGENGRWLGVVIVMHDVSELVRLEQIRRDFVANVSHEFRTPVTSIKGFSETLLDGAFKDEQMLLSFLEIIHKESNRLQVLVNDLLDLSKIEQYGFAIEANSVSLQEVIIRVVELTEQKMDAQNMQFDIQIPKDIRVLGEMNRLIQIVVNLVTNAILYSNENTIVKIKVYSDHEYGFIDVVDEGIGISEQDQRRIFERFYRVDRARTSYVGGTGLGLAIVKHLVEAHQGKIKVKSEMGQGTTMTIAIPRAN